MSAIPVVMTEEQYQQHVNDFDGVCLKCGEIRYGDTEGDAENYPCESCGKKAVQGIEMAMIAGNITIVDAEE